MTELKPMIIQIDGHRLVMKPLRIEGGGVPVICVAAPQIPIPFSTPLMIGVVPAIERIRVAMVDLLEF